jgi:hypothetical protein
MPMHPGTFRFGNHGWQFGGGKDDAWNQNTPSSSVPPNNRSNTLKKSISSDCRIARQWATNCRKFWNSSVREERPLRYTYVATSNCNYRCLRLTEIPSLLYLAVETWRWVPSFSEWMASRIWNVASSRFDRVWLIWYVKKNRSFYHAHKYWKWCRCWRVTANLRWLDFELFQSCYRFPLFINEWWFPLVNGNTDLASYPHDWILNVTARF